MTNILSLFEDHHEVLTSYRNHIYHTKHSVFYMWYIYMFDILDDLVYYGNIPEHISNNCVIYLAQCKYSTFYLLTSIICCADILVNGDTVLLCAAISPLQLIHVSMQVSGSLIDLIVFCIDARFVVSSYFITRLPIKCRTSRDGHSHD